MLPGRMLIKEAIIVLIGEAVIGRLTEGGDHQALTEERGEAPTMELALALVLTEEKGAVLNMVMVQVVVLVE